MCKITSMIRVAVIFNLLSGGRIRETRTVWKVLRVGCGEGAAFVEEPGGHGTTGGFDCRNGAFARTGNGDLNRCFEVGGTLCFFFWFFFGFFFSIREM